MLAVGIVAPLLHWGAVPRENCFIEPRGGMGPGDVCPVPLAAVRHGGELGKLQSRDRVGIVEGPVGPEGSIQNTEDKTVSRSGYHTNRISPNRRRSLDILLDLNLQHNLEDKGMANHMDNHWILYSQRKATNSCVRISEPSALLAILVEQNTATS